MSPMTNACLKKTATFRTKAEAWEAIGRWEAMGRCVPKTLKPYRCPGCEQVHVTTVDGTRRS